MIIFEPGDRIMSGDEGVVDRYKHRHGTVIKTINNINDQVWVQLDGDREQVWFTPRHLRIVISQNII
jgi:hypothetical protein